MTWDEIGRDSLEAAKLLQDAGKYRSSVSRSYYAVYARVTALLTPFADFPEGREGLATKTYQRWPTFTSPGFRTGQDSGWKICLSAFTSDAYKPITTLLSPLMGQ